MVLPLVKAIPNDINIKVIVSDKLVIYDVKYFF